MNGRGKRPAYRVNAIDMMDKTQPGYLSTFQDRFSLQSSHFRVNVDTTKGKLKETN